jgi:hypothetical protein
VTREGSYDRLLHSVCAGWTRKESRQDKGESAQNVIGEDDKIQYTARIARVAWRGVAWRGVAWRGVAWAQAIKLARTGGLIIV